MKKKKKEKRLQIAVHLDEIEEMELNKHLTRTGVKKGFFVKMAIVEKLEKEGVSW